MEFGKVFRFFGNKVTPGLPKLLVHVTRTFLRETALLGKRTTFSSIPEFEQKVFIILTGIFGQGDHNRILRAQMKFFFIFWKREVKEKILLFENFALLSFSDFERKRSLVLLQAWLRQACQKFVVHVQTKIFAKNFSGRLTIFSSIPEIQQKFFQSFNEKISAGCSQLLLYMYMGTFWGKLCSFRKNS